MPAEIHHQFFGLPGIELEVVLLAPVHKVHSVIPTPDEADDSRVIMFTNFKVFLNNKMFNTVY